MRHGTTTNKMEGSNLASKWFTMAQNEFRQQRNLWNKLMHYESPSEGDASDCSFSVYARTETRCMCLHKLNAMLKEV